jgi:hypothetical protein
MMAAVRAGSGVQMHQLLIQMACGLSLLQLHLEARKDDWAASEAAKPVMHAGGSDDG